MSPVRTAILAIVLLGCDGSVCDPGATQACVCAGGTAGAQSCVASGEGWGACDCGAADAGGGLDSGFPTDAGGGLDAGSPTDTGTGSDATAGDDGSVTARPDECTFVACGGDPRGTWADSEICLSPREPPCDGIVYTSDTLTWPQTLDIRSDGTYTWERLAGSRSADFVVPASCIDPTVTRCADYPRSGMISVGVTTCTGDVTVECMCRWRATLPGAMPEIGTWSRTRNLITFTDGTSTARRFQLCVTDRWLQLLPDDGSPVTAGRAVSFERP